MPAATKSDQTRTIRPGLDLLDERRPIEVLSPLSFSPWWMPASSKSDQSRIVGPGVDLLDELRSIDVFNPPALSLMAYLTAVWAGVAAWAATQAAGAIVTQAVLRANPAWLRIAAQAVRSAPDSERNTGQISTVEMLTEIEPADQLPERSTG